MNSNIGFRRDQNSNSATEFFPRSRLSQARTELIICTNSSRDSLDREARPATAGRVALGLLTLNAAPIRSSAKSISEPLRKSSDTGSIRPSRHPLDDQIVVEAGIVEGEIVLEARASPPVTATRSITGAGSRFQDLRDPLGRAGGDSHGLARSVLIGSMPYSMSLCSHPERRREKTVDTRKGPPGRLQGTLFGPIFEPPAARPCDQPPGAADASIRRPKAPRGPATSATAIASSIRRPSAASSTRRRSSCSTRAIISVRGSRIR